MIGRNKNWISSVFIFFSSLFFLLIACCSLCAMGQTGDFEWTPIDEVFHEDNHQHICGFYNPYGLIKDEQENLYLTYKHLPQSTTSPIDPYEIDHTPNITIIKYDENNRTFIKFSEGSYSNVIDFIIFNQTVYALHYNQTSQYIYLTIENKIIYYYLGIFPDGEGNAYNSISFLNVSADSIEIIFIKMTILRDGNGQYITYLKITHWEIDPISYKLVERILLNENLQYRILSSEKQIVRNQFLYMWEATASDDIMYYLFRYDIDNAVIGAPVKIYSSNSQQPDWRFGMASDNRIHFLQTNPPMLVNISLTGQIAAKLNLTNNLREGFSPIKMIVDINGHIYIVGRCYIWYSAYIILYSTSTEYDEKLKERLVSNQNEYSSLPLMISNRTNHLYIIWTGMNNLVYRIYYAHQTPLLPDLSIDDTFFSFSASENHSIILRFRIKNIGNASAHQFTLIVSYCQEENTGIQILRQTIKKTIIINQSYPIDYSGFLPHGRLKIMIEIVDVIPYENRIDNNRFEIWIFNENNNIPFVDIEDPRNETFHSTYLQINGTTFDLDCDDVVSTYLYGLAGTTYLFNGTGDWTFNISTIAIPSGEYLLVFMASDRIENSLPVYRHIYIDHLNDGLLYKSRTPPGDIDILVDTTEYFSVNIIDRFNRPLKFDWIINDIPIDDTPTFPFSPNITGFYRIEVIITNDRTSIKYEWNVTVRDPTIPFISFSSPTTNLEIFKKQALSFQIVVSNPDSLKYSLLWVLNTEILSNNDSAFFKYNFTKVGIHSVSLYLFSKYGFQNITWNVTVRNHVPEIISQNPDEFFNITNQTSLTLSINVSDLDNDNLVFHWISDELNIDRTSSESFITIQIPNNNVSLFKMRVEICDENDMISTSWTLNRNAQNDSHPENPPLDNWMYIIILGVSIIMILILISFYIYRKEIVE